MKEKKIKSITVAYASGHKNNDVPMIRIQGAWLRELGFEVGDKISAECQKGQIVIRAGDKDDGNHS